MSNPLPLDAAARDELARKAESLAACLEGSDPWLKRGDLISLFPSETAEFIAACTPETILALLAAAQRGEEDTRDAERYRLLKPHLIVDGDMDDADYATRHYRWVQFKDERVMVPDSWAGYADADAALDAARSATPTEGDDR